MRISDWSSDVCSSDLNVEPHQAALGAAPGILRMPRLRYGNPGHFGAFSFVTPPGGHLLPYDPDAEEETVARVALDDLDLPACQFMKIDVEGMEGEIGRASCGERVSQCV